MTKKPPSDLEIIASWLAPLPPRLIERFARAIPQEPEPRDAFLRACREQLERHV